MIKGDWTISFLWRPESSWREIHGTLPIATVHDVEGGYIEVSFNGAEGRFEVTDGADTVHVATTGWEHGDLLKLALSQDTTDTAIYIETPAQGTLKDETANGIAIDGALHYLQFSANADKEVKGVGLFGEVKYFDKEMTEAEVQKIFDLDPTAEKPVLAPRARDFLFNRDSIRFDRQVNLIESGKALLESVPVTSRIATLTKEAYPDATDQRPLWIEGDRVIVARGNRVQSVDPSDFSLTTIIDTATTEPFASEIGETSVQTGKELPDGSRLLSLSGGYIYRWDPTTEAWSQVLRMGAGDPFVAGGVILQFGWSGIKDNRVVIGEYGTTNDVDQGRRVYLSEDYGKTWGMIYDRDKRLDPGHETWTSSEGWHVHTCVFHPTNPDIIYVAYGDGAWRQIIKLTYIGTGSRLDAANWSASGTGYEMQPTSAFAYGNKIYWGQDGETYDQTITEHDPSDDSFRGVLLLPRIGGTWDESPFDSDNGGGLSNSSYVWRITRMGGILYAGMSGGSGDYGGIFCSVNGRAWTRAFYKTADVIGVRDFIGIDSAGRLWVEYGPDGGGRKPGYLTPPKITQVEMVSAEGGATNALDAVDSHLSAAEHNYTPLRSFDAALTGRDTNVALYGDASYKIVMKRQSTYTFCRWDLAEETIGAGQYFAASGHFKLGGILLTPDVFHALPKKVISPISRLTLSTSPNADGLRYEACRITMLRDGWFVAKLMGKNNSGVAINANLRFLLYLTSAWPVEDYGEVIVWTDCVQFYTSASPLPLPATFQPGGTPRADEILIAPAFDVGRGGVEMAGFIGGRGFIG